MIIMNVFHSILLHSSRGLKRGSSKVPFSKRFGYGDASIASLLYNVPLAYDKKFENCHKEGDLHANVPCKLLLYRGNELLLSSFF